jgi:AraC-like DNA-binding protein
MFPAPLHKHQGSDNRPGPDVVTVVEATLQDRLILALGEVARPVHLASVSAALTVVRERPVRAVLLGQESMTAGSATAVGRLAVTCGGTLIAVLEGWTPNLSDTLLAFGRHGVRDAVDVSTRQGLSRLRDLITRSEWELANRVAKALEPSLKESSDEMRFFVNYLVRTVPLVGSITVLAARLGVSPSSLNSRFMRAGLPSPRKYLTYTRLLFAAAVLEEPRVSAAQVAHRLNYSSPQSFMRHVRQQLGVSVSELRQHYSFEALAHHVAFHTLSKHGATLNWFRPLGTITPDGEDRTRVE